MLFIKRFVTAAGCFLLLFVVLFIGTLFVGGAVAGGIAGAKDPQNAEQAGAKAGEKFGKNYAQVILVGSVGVAGVASCILAFGGILPWCKKEDSTAMDEFSNYGNISDFKNPSDF